MQLQPYRGYEKGYSQAGQQIGGGISRTGEMVGQEMLKAPQREKEKLQLDEMKKKVEQATKNKDSFNSLKKTLAGDVTDTANELEWSHKKLESTLKELNGVQYDPKDGVGSVGKLQKGVSNLSQFSDTMEQSKKDDVKMYDWEPRSLFSEESGALFSGNYKKNKLIKEAVTILEEKKPATAEEAMSLLSPDAAAVPEVEKYIKGSYQKGITPYQQEQIKLKKEQNRIAKTKAKNQGKTKKTEAEIKTEAETAKAWGKRFERLDDKLENLKSRIKNDSPPELTDQIARLELKLRLAEQYETDLSTGKMTESKLNRIVDEQIIKEDEGAVVGISEEGAETRTGTFSPVEKRMPSTGKDSPPLPSQPVSKLDPKVVTAAMQKKGKSQAEINRYLENLRTRGLLNE